MRHSLPRQPRTEGDWSLAVVRDAQQAGPREVKVWCAGYDGSFSGKVYTLERTVPVEGNGGGDG